MSKPLLISCIVVVLVSGWSPTPARASSIAGTWSLAPAHSLAGRVQAVPALSFTAARLGVGDVESGPMLAQRILDEGETRPEPDTEPDTGDERDGPDQPPPVEMDMVMGQDEQTDAPSPVTAMLLSAALPGAGQLYLGNATGYVYLGVEGVTWITWASFNSSADSRESDMFAFADRNFSRTLFDQNCVGQDGQSCSQASVALNDFWESDRAEYYEIISKNTIYKSGWGTVQFENEVPPELGTEAYRVWIADLAVAQDDDFISYNEIRDDRNDKSRTARSMMMVTLLNRVTSAWHAFFLGRGLERSVAAGDFEFTMDVDASFSNPGVVLMMERSFF